jgi:actin related protein 2/3 complex subunit 1A/1B
MASNQKPQDLFLLEGISCFAFNKDFTKVALSKKDNVIYIYSIPNLMKTDTWKLETTLDTHVQYISGLDWNAKTNEILSCSHDKTSYVWTYSDKKWTPSNVVATTKLGYLCCKWNSRGDKFCEGTSAKQLLIGYYNTGNNWWMGKNIKVHKSSVVCCEIDPTSLFVLSGSTDLRVYVSSCYMPDIDDKHLTDQTKPLAQDFGAVIYEFRPNCWLNSVTWNASGSLGFAAGQDATVAVIDYKNQKTDLIKCKHSPVTIVVPNGENSFLAVCYDRNILEYEKKGDKWEIKKTITTDQGKKATASKGNVSSAVQRFQQMGVQKKENLAVTSKQASHLHQSIISSMNIKGKDVITTDVSGFVKYWKL